MANTEEKGFFYIGDSARDIYNHPIIQSDLPSLHSFSIDPISLENIVNLYLTRKSEHFEDIEFLAKHYGSFIKKRLKIFLRNYRYYLLKELIVATSKLENQNLDLIKKRKLLIYVD